MKKSFDNLITTNLRREKRRESVYNILPYDFLLTIPYVFGNIMRSEHSSKIDHYIDG